MELDDLKNTWDEVNDQVKQQIHLTPKMIDQMTRTKYTANLKKIAYPEMIGTVICFMGAGYIGFNFGKLDTAFLQGAGIITILLLLVLPVTSLVSLRQFNIPKDIDQPHSEVLKSFAIQKLQFYKLQKISLLLSYLLLVTMVVLMSKIFGVNDITKSKYFWTCSFAIGYIFLLFYSKWVTKYYSKTLRQTEELLKELES